MSLATHFQSNCLPIVYNRLSVIKGLGLGRCVLAIGLPKIEGTQLKYPLHECRHFSLAHINQGACIEGGGGEDFNYNYLGLDHEDTKNASLSLPLAIYTARRG